MESSDSKSASDQGKSSKKIHSHYTSPKLTVFGKINDMTKATKQHGSRTDGTYTCGEDRKSPCYS